MSEGKAINAIFKQIKDLEDRLSKCESLVSASLASQRGSSTADRKVILNANKNKRGDK